MKKKERGMSVTTGVCMPSSVTLLFLLIFGGMTFLWPTGGRSPAENWAVGGILAVMVAISLILTVAASKAVLRPIREMDETITEVTAGNLARRMDTGATGGLGDVGTHFNAMMDGLRDALYHASESSKQISFASNTLEATGRIMTKGVGAIVNEVSSVASASEQMASTSSEIARNCAVAAESSDMVSRSALAGENIIQGIVEAMNGIGRRVRESAGAIKGLGERSDQIGQIAGIINDIADQTNLLALNAAIEAARAGEHGRGFAVVADEVRKLAERTAEATKEIGTTIEAMQAETKSAVVFMEEGVREVESGTEETARSGSSLKEILLQVNTLASQINQIAVASEEQTATTSEITLNIQKISEVMEHASGNIQENGEASSQIAALTHKLNGLMQKYRFQETRAVASSKREDAVALVEKAADYYRTHGREKAIAEFNNPKGMFVKGDLYVFVQDLTGIMKAHPQNPILIGKYVSDLKDVNGKAFGRELVDTARTKGSGWVDYDWMNPATREVDKKSTYCMRADDIILGCGIYR